MYIRVDGKCLWLSSAICYLAPKAALARSEYAQLVVYVFLCFVALTYQVLIVVLELGQRHSLF